MVAFLKYTFQNHFDTQCIVGTVQIFCRISIVLNFNDSIDNFVAGGKVTFRKQALSSCKCCLSEGSLFAHLVASLHCLPLHFFSQICLTVIEFMVSIVLPCSWLSVISAAVNFIMLSEWHFCCSFG